MPIKHETKPIALLALSQHTECFIVCIARARPCLKCFKELTYEHLVKAYPFQLLPIRQLRHLELGKTILDDILCKRFSK